MTYTICNPSTGAVFTRDVDSEREEIDLLADIARFGWEIVEVE